ncbi:MAG: hypothetical protein ACHQVS_02785 [Candidatus Babeliales bacterium]
MKMFNVYAAALALLVVSNGVKAGDHMMGMQNGALPSFGLKNDTKQNLFVYIMTNDDRQALGMSLAPNDVLPFTQEQWNNIKDVRVRLSVDKRAKGHLITHCSTGDAENPMALSDLRGNTRWNYLSLTKPTKGGHYTLQAIDRANIAAPYQVKGTDYTACVTCSK